MPVSPCTIAQAQSALIKHVRLRKTEDAVYWFHHVSLCFPEAAFKLHRRVFIMAAEDCIEPVVQSAAYDWLKLALSSKDQKEVAASASYIISYICSTNNWWSSPSGQKYILLWRETEKICKEDHKYSMYTVSQHLESLMKAAAEGDTRKAFIHHMLMLKQAKNYKVYVEYAQRMVGLAISTGNLPARIIAQYHLTHSKLLSTFDDNWLGQALFRLCGNQLGDGKWVVPDHEVVSTMHTNSIKEVYSYTRKPPAWTQDGIHCAGSDTRFAGVLSSMVGCCNQFNRQQELNPDTPWDSTTRSTEELHHHVFG